MALIVQVDFSGNGVFTDANEDVTALLIGSIQTTTGRDSDPITGYAGPGQFRAVLDNRTGIYSPFNSSGALFGNLKPGRMVRVLEGATVLWIGRLTKLQPFSSPESAPTAVIEAQGILAEAANMKIPPLVTGGGEATGTLIAAALTNAGMVTTGIAAGDILTGPYGASGSALVPLLSEIRKLEDPEIGFLHEDVDSYRLLYHDRSHRAALTTPLAVFSDAASPPLRYTGVQEEDWVGNIYNRATAGTSAWEVGTEALLVTMPGPFTLNPSGTQDLLAAYSEKPVLDWNGHLRDIYYGSVVPTYVNETLHGSGTQQVSHSFTLPATVNANDLLLVRLHTNVDFATMPNQGLIHIFTSHYSTTGYFHIFAKNAVGTEDGATVSFDLASAGTFSGATMRFTSWHGDVASIEVSAAATGSSAAPDSPALTPSWGALRAYFFSLFMHETGTGGPTTPPTGYTQQGNTGLSAIGPFPAQFLATARKAEATGVATENPSAWAVTGSENWTAFTVAVRGARQSSLNVTGATPADADPAFSIAYDASLGGGVGYQEHENIRITGTPLEGISETFVQANYTPSQDADDGVGIRTYPKAPAMFETPADAQTYADLIVARYGEAVPVMALTYRADIDATHLAQAIARKVGDRITLIADNSMMLGLNEDFFIESVSRVIDVNEHYVTYTLSPASVTD